MLRNHFPWPNANLLHKDKEHLALRNNFRVTKKCLINKFDCITWFDFLIVKVLAGFWFMHEIGHDLWNFLWLCNSDELLKKENISIFRGRVCSTCLAFLPIRTSIFMIDFFFFLSLSLLHFFWISNFQSYLYFHSNLLSCKNPTR